MLCSLRRTINLFTALGESESYFILCSIAFCETCTHTEFSFWMQVSRQLIWSVRVHRMKSKEGCIREIINYVMVDFSWIKFKKKVYNMYKSILRTVFLLIIWSIAPRIRRNIILIYWKVKMKLYRWFLNKNSCQK